MQGGRLIVILNCHTHLTQAEVSGAQSVELPARSRYKYASDIQQQGAGLLGLELTTLAVSSFTHVQCLRGVQK